MDSKLPMQKTQNLTGNGEKLTNIPRSLKEFQKVIHTDNLLEFGTDAKIFNGTTVRLHYFLGLRRMELQKES